MQDYSTLDQSQLNSVLGGNTGGSLIPESLMPLLIIGFVLINLLSIAFFVFWFMGMVRRWKVQTAVLKMQKDIMDIKEALAHSNQPAAATNAPQSPVQHESTATQQPQATPEVPAAEPTPPTNQPG